LKGLFESEPALIIAGCGAIIWAVLIVAITFGVPITPDQKLALSGALGVIVTVTTGWVTRGQVTSPATLATLGLPVGTVAEPPEKGA